MRHPAAYLLCVAVICACDKNPSGVKGGRLAFVVQPTSVANTRVSIAPFQVAIQDAAGNTAKPSGAVTITLAIASGTGAADALLSGQGVRTVAGGANGIATFDGMSISKYGTGYALVASANGLSSATSAPFNVTPPPDPSPENLTIYVADLPSGEVVSFTDMAGSNWTAGPTVAGRVLRHPWHIGLDAAGKLYVMNRDDAQLVRMDDVAGNGFTTFGPQGLVDGTPSALAKSVYIDPSNHIHTVVGNSIVRIDNMTGAGRVQFGASPSGPGPFSNPKVIIATRGHFYVSDTDAHRIVRFDDMTGAGFVAFGTQGSGVGQFNRPEGLAVDSLGRIYVTDNENHRIVRINDMSGAGWTTLGSLGSGVNQFNEPHDIAISPAGRIYVADAGNTRIVRINDMNGAGWITLGTSPVVNPCTNPDAFCARPPKFEFLAPKGIRLRP